MSRAALFVVVAAVAAGDAAAEPELDRVRREASLASSADLERQLAAPARAERLAAIAAATAVPDGAELLDDLAVLAAGWDRSLAAPAARAARQLARRLVGGEGGLPAPVGGPPPGEPAELDDDALEQAQAAWLTLALRADRWADVRVHALEIVVALGERRARTAAGVPPAYDVAALVADVDPEVRRAALELLPVPLAPHLRPLLARTLAGDPVATVRLAAAQALCAGLPAERAPVLAALGPDGLEALRSLLAPEDNAPAPPAGAAAIDAGRCLAAEGSPASRRALDELRGRLPRALRPALATVMAGARTGRGR